MKKKLTAVLLTLCMVLGMLPLSVLAATYKDATTNKTFTDPTPVEGQLVTDTDGNKYYVKSVDTDKFTYYTNGTLSGATGTATLVPEGEPEPVYVTITFDVNAPEGPTAPKAPDPKKIEAGTAIGTLPTLAIDGYVFGGWIDEDGTVVTEKTVFEEDATLTAVWTKAVDAREEVTLSEEEIASGTVETEVDIDADAVEKAIEESEDKTAITLGVKKSDSTTKEQVKALKHETVRIPAAAVLAAAKFEGMKTVQVAALTGTVSLDAGALAAKLENKTGEVDFVIDLGDEEDVSDAQETALEGAGLVAAAGAKIHEIDVSLTIGDDAILDGTGEDVEVSVQLDMGEDVSYEELAMLFLGDKVEVHPATNYADGVISWMTNHLSPWGGVKVEIIDDSATDATQTAVIEDDDTGSYFKVTFEDVEEGDWFLWDVKLENGSHTANCGIITDPDNILIGKPSEGCEAAAWATKAENQPLWVEGLLEVEGVVSWNYTEGWLD